VKRVWLSHSAIVKSPGLLPMLYTVRELSEAIGVHDPTLRDWLLAGAPHFYDKKVHIWMTAIWFGLGHYYGGISFGAMGAIFFTLVAVLSGKAMLETRGLAMPVFMHLLGDVVLYLILALGSA
jgi:hypothetical protein